MNLYNCSVVGTKDNSNNIANYIEIIEAKDAIEAKKKILNLFVEQYPEYNIDIVIVDLITLNMDIEFSVSTNKIL